MQRRHFFAAAGLSLPFARSIFAAAEDPRALQPASSVADSVESRRLEILRWFETNVYGHPPSGIRSSVSWKPASVPHPTPEVSAEDGMLTLISAEGKEMKIPLKLYRPQKSKTPVPAAIFICNRSREFMEFSPDAEFWPMEKIVKAGWLTVAFNVKDVANDEPAELVKQPGLLALDMTPPGESRGGATSAWAFVASEIRAHLTRRSEVAADRISIAGHSRGGKAAILAGARDREFAVTFPATPDVLAPLTT